MWRELPRGWSLEELGSSWSAARFSMQRRCGAGWRMEDDPGVAGIRLQKMGSVIGPANLGSSCRERSGVEGLWSEKGGSVGLGSFSSAGCREALGSSCRVSRGVGFVSDREGLGGESSPEELAEPLDR